MNSLVKNYSNDVYYTETYTRLNEKLNHHSDLVPIGGGGTVNILSNVLAGKNISYHTW